MTSDEKNRALLSALLLGLPPLSVTRSSRLQTSWDELFEEMKLDRLANNLTDEEREGAA